MAMSNHTWEEETRQTLSSIQSELHEAEQEFEEVREKVSRLTREAEAMKMALEIHLNRTGKQVSVESDLRLLLASQKNHEERLKRIAERNNGIVKVNKATDILFNYGLIKSKSRMNAYRILYGLLMGMVEEGLFERPVPGEFRLINYMPTLELSQNKS